MTNGLWDDLEGDNPIWTRGDYHLQTDSPCVDVGSADPILDPNQVDMDGESRIIGVTVDMGIDESILRPKACPF